jgi:hypothetical protein
MAPAQVEEILSIAVVVPDHCARAFRHRNRHEIPRGRLGAFPEPRVTRHPVQSREEIPDAGGAVREVGHVPLEGRGHEPGEPVLHGFTQLEQMQACADSGLARVRQFQNAVKVEQREPDP